MSVMQKILSALERDGLLLEADSVMPSVATIIAGEPIRGSWWGHKAGKTIYNTCEALIDRDDILRLKLLKGKVTYVHQKHWSDLIAIAVAREAWQVEDLSPAGKKLLGYVDKKGVARTDEKPANLVVADARAAAKELEDKLLVLGYSIHTESGAHAKGIESWRSWMTRIGFKGVSIEVQDAYARIEVAVAILGLQPKKGALPWPWKK